LCHIGRFITRDTYGGDIYQPWTQNLYTYCNNNPVNFVDPTGHIPIRKLAKSIDSKATVTFNNKTKTATVTLSDGRTATAKGKITNGVMDVLPPLLSAKECQVRQNQERYRQTKQVQLRIYLQRQQMNMST